MQGIQDTEHLSSITSSGSRVDQEKTDLLGGINDEDIADGESNALAELLEALFIHHIIEERDLSVEIGNDGEVKLLAGRRSVLDILEPLLVGLQRVRAETNQLRIALGKLVLENREGAELGGADWGEIGGVGEENSPRVANEFVEINLTLGGDGLEVRSNGSDSDTGLSTEVDHS